MYRGSPPTTRFHLVRQLTAPPFPLCGIYLQRKPTNGIWWCCWCRGCWQLFGRDSEAGVWYIFWTWTLVKNFDSLRVVTLVKELHSRVRCAFGNDVIKHSYSEQSHIQHRSTASFTISTFCFWENPTFKFQSNHKLDGIPFCQILISKRMSNRKALIRFCQYPYQPVKH